MKPPHLKISASIYSRGAENISPHGCLLVVNICQPLDNLPRKVLYFNYHIS